MSSMDYKQFYDRVGKHNGWDFSSVKCKIEGEGLELYNEVANMCKSGDLLLDIGTGGGEAVLSLAKSVLLLVGIDQSSSMIEAALRNSRAAGAANTRFLQMDAERLNFPDAFFNIVSCRHSPFHADEAARILIKGGVFLTQQVNENDKLNLKQAFGRGQAFDEQPGTLMQRYITELRAAGFSKVQSIPFNVNEYYETAEDLIFLLKHTPIIPNFGQDERDFQILQQFIAENTTDKGIQTNAARFILIAS